jgi:hypothetical protein
MATTPTITWDDEETRQSPLQHVQWDETPAQTANDVLAKQGLSVSEPSVPNPEAGPAKPPARPQTSRPVGNLTKQQADASIAATDIRPRSQNYGDGGRFNVGTPPPRSMVSGLVTEQAERAKGAGAYRIQDRDVLAAPFGRNPVPAPVESAVPQGQSNISVTAPKDQRLTKMQYENSISPTGEVFTAGETDVRPPADRKAAPLTPQEQEEIAKAITSPENIANNAIYPGIGSMGSSLTYATKGDVATAAAKFLGGAGEALSPMIGPDAAEIARGGELARAIWLGTTMAGGQGADIAVRKIGKDRGWSPERIEAASQAAQWLVPVLSLTHGVARGAAELTPSAQNARAHVDLVNATTEHILNTIGIKDPDVLQYNAARRYAEKVVAENFAEAGTAMEKYKAAINKREAAKRVREATANQPPIEEPAKSKAPPAGSSGKPGEATPGLVPTKPTAQPKVTDVTWDDEQVSPAKTDNSQGPLVSTNPSTGKVDNYEQAKDLVSKAGKASTSMLQRHLKIGYGEAAKLVDRMQQDGLIGKDRAWTGKPVNEGQKPGGNGQRPVVQGSSSPAEIRQSAEAQKPKINEMAQQAVASVEGGKVEGTRVKDAESQENKEQRGKPPETNIDNLGARVSGETPEAIEQIKDNIEQKLPVVDHKKITSNGIDADQYTVRTGKPGEANQVSEIQVLSKPQADALKKTDELYHQQKEALAAGDQKKADELGKQIEKIHQEAQQEFQKPEPVAVGTTVGTAAGAKADNNFIQQAKQELGPDASASDVLRRAEDLKRHKNGTPQYVYRSRDVGEQGVPSQSHSQATVSKQEAERYLTSRGNTTGKEQELVRVDLSKLPPDSYERKPGPNGHDWIKFKHDVPESAVERVHQLPESQQAKPETHKFVDKAVEKANNSASEGRGPTGTDQGLPSAAGRGEAESDRGTGHRLDVYSTVDDKTGQRVVGVEIPKEQIQRVLNRITGGASTVTTAQVIPDVLNNGTQYDLEGGIKLRRGRVARQSVVQFVASNPNTLKDLKDMGVLHEIGIQPIYYLPTDSSKARTVMDKVLERYPVKAEGGSNGQRNSSGGSAAPTSTNGGTEANAGEGNHEPVSQEEIALEQPGRSDRNQPAPSEGNPDELRARGGGGHPTSAGQGEENDGGAPQANGKELKTGDRVTFSKTPPGSYLHAGEYYTIDHADDSYVYFHNDKTGGATSVHRADLRLSQYTKVDASGRPISEDEGGAVLSANPLFDPRNWKKAGKAYDTAIDRFIDRGLKIGDKYYHVAEYDPKVADNLHLLDNAPRYMREKALANIASVTEGLNKDQVRLAALMADSDSRDYLQEKHPDEYHRALHDPKVMQAVRKFEPLQDELADDRVALGWPVRLSLQAEEDPTVNEGEIGRWTVKDRDGNLVSEFEKEREARKFVEENGIIEPHLKRTYPEHLRQPLPFQTAEQGQGPWTGAFYREPGVRPPRMDKKARLASAEYHYQKGAHDFSGYVESYRRVKEAMLKQNIYDDFTTRATPWKVGTAQPPQITYNGKTYYRPDIAVKMRAGGEKNVQEYSVYDPTRGERFLVSTPDFSVITTGKPGITAKDRWLAPRPVVDGLEQYDASRGGKGAGKIKRFFQEQIVGFYGPMVHVNNIIRRIGQAIGTGTFDPRSWVSIAKVIGSADLRHRVMQGVNDDTIDMLTQRGAYTDWGDIGNLNHYIGGNLNPFNWVRAFGKGVLFDPRFAGGWGGLDPKARVILADFLKDHIPGITDQEIADAVNDAFGNYNRANWTERQRLLAKFTLFPGWDTASAKWFLRHPFKVAIAPALVVLLANLVMNMLGKNKDQDKYDFSYLHYGDRRWRWGGVTDSFGLKLGRPILEPMRASLEGRDSREVAGSAGQGLVDAGIGLASYLRPDIMGMAEVASNREVLGRSREVWNPGDEYQPGKVMPNRKLDKIVAHTVIRSFPAVSRWLAADQTFDAETGLTSIAGITTYPYGAEQRLRENEAKARGYSVTISHLAETDPESADSMAEDPNKAAYLMFHGDLSQMLKDLKQIDTESDKVRTTKDLTAEEKSKTLDSLDAARKQLLKSADTLNDQLFAAKREAGRNPENRSRGAELLNVLSRANGQTEAP